MVYKTHLFNETTFYVGFKRFFRIKFGQGHVTKVNMPTKLLTFLSKQLRSESLNNEREREREREREKERERQTETDTHSEIEKVTH